MRSRAAHSSHPIHRLITLLLLLSTFAGFGSAAPQASAQATALPNDAWTRASSIDLQSASGGFVGERDQVIATLGESRWFKFSVISNSQLTVTLTNLPASYELTVYKDIAQAYQTLLTPQDLVRLGAEFAPDAFSPDAFSPDAFSPDAFSPDAFSPDAFSPDAFSPDAFSPDAFSPDAFSPDAFSPDAFSPDAFSPDAFSPDAFSPDAFSPDAFSPDADAYASAQQRSLIGVSAFEGTSGQGIRLNTWNNTGDFYVRVRGRNGAFDAANPFRLRVFLTASGCPASEIALPPISTSATDANFRTLILADLTRLSGTSAEKDALLTRLNTLAARPEVQGVVVPVNLDARVQAANAQADALPACPYAKNLVADSVKQIIDAYWAQNPLEYLVVVGNDDVIPFYRYPDQASLAAEQNYVPPVRDTTTSQASLRLNYLLSQDAYGAKTTLALKSNELPLADLAVGRLVETAADISAVVDAYLGTSSGVVATPSSALVTGYDFLEDAALAVESELEAGLGAQADTLIADRSWSPADPRSWDADALREALLGERHDLIFLAGHFSASSALAADYQTRLQTTDLINSPVNLTNAIIFSPGCHSGYNVVNEHGISGITREPDWAQAFAKKQATLIAGTGYQYGDTDFIYYSEQLYLEFSRQLRAGSGPIAVGKALTAAKRAYLTSTAPTRSIFEKSYLIATLYGLPMLKVDMPGARYAPEAAPSVIGATSAVGSDPGYTLGLHTADLTVHPTLTPQYLQLTNVQEPDTSVTATYYTGADGVQSGPAEPVLPLEIRNVSVPNTVLRGVGFRGGYYTDQTGIRPLTGSATSEVRSVRPPFQSGVHFPVRPWGVNYWGALVDPAYGATNLTVTPAQFISPDLTSATGTLRKFSSMNFRLFYSSNIATFGAGNVPALAAAPAISRIEARTDPYSHDVTFSARVTGDPAAGIQEVWITYTATQGSLYGRWVACNLVQDPHDSTLWTGTLNFGSLPPSKLRFMVQAANGVGLVSLMTNQGQFYTPDIIPGDPPSAAQQATNLTLSAPASATYGVPVSVSATLKRGATALANQTVVFALGAQRRAAKTDAAGVATATMLPLGIPGSMDVRAAFAETATLQGSSASTTLTLGKQPTTLTLAPASASVLLGEESGVIANISGASGRPLGQQTVVFIVSNGTHTYTLAEISDYLGNVPLGIVPLPAGTYTVSAYYLGTIPLPSGATTLVDPRYLPAVATSQLTLRSPDTTPPITTAVVSGAQHPSCPADCFIGSATVTLTTNEPATTSYRIKLPGGVFGPLQNYTAPFVLTAEGISTVEFSSVDLVGNQETPRTITVKITKAPSTPVLDSFDRMNGSVGANWQGETGGYRIYTNRLRVGNGGPITWKPTAFGVNQEAYITLHGLKGHEAVLLKSQSGGWQKGVIAVYYNHTDRRVGIEVYTPTGGWVTLQSFSRTLRPGDQLAGQALANGDIKVYVNCELVGTARSTFFANKGGQIGLWFITSSGTTMDNFGGGNFTP